MARLPLLLSALALCFGLWAHQLWSPVDITIIGNVTVDLVDGKKSLGGAVSYAAAVVSAFGKRACVVTANSDDADLGEVFKGHDLVTISSSHTLVFEHSYTFWGNHRKLRVAAQPNVTLTVAHLPPRCRRARVLLLGPLMPEDLDPQGFVQLAARPWWHRALGLPVQRVGLMAQGLQRALEGGGRVRQQAQPSPQLVDSLGPSTLVFLSDVETEVWANGTVAELAARTSRFLVTRGKDGADEWRRGALRHVPVWEVEQVVDTNGAGDTFATAYMLAEAAGHSSPISVAHWAGGLAVGQPQACKPACVTTALQAGWASRPVSQRGLAWPTMHRLLLPPLQHAARMLGLAQGGSAAAAA